MTSNVLRRYSLALYDASVEQNLLKKIYKEIETFIQLGKSSRELELFFSSPSIRTGKKLEITGKLFSKSLNPLLLNFIKLIIGKNREALLFDILSDFIELKNEREGLSAVSVKTTVELTEKEKDTFKKKIDKYTNLNSVPEFSVDDSLIGGFTIQIKDNILDASIKRQLELLKQNLNKGIIS
jgi:F-type H+-transporting ATPase subunit delta